jgi:microcystin-dependent protein
MDQLLASIMLFAGNFPPQGWAYCDGSLLNVQQYQALFAVIGNTFGGNGSTTFALPDLRGRVPLGAGQGPSLQNYLFAKAGGIEQVALATAQLPAHTHTTPPSAPISASSAQATISAPSSSVHTLAAPYDVLNSNPIAGYNNATPNIPLNTGGAAGVTGTAGSNSPVSILQPFLGLNYIIATEGIFPTRP